MAYEAFSTGNVVAAAISEMESHYSGDPNKRLVLNRDSISFIFMGGEYVVKEADYTAIAAYLEALAWVDEVVIRWRVPEIVIRVTEEPPE